MNLFTPPDDAEFEAPRHEELIALEAAKMPWKKAKPAFPVSRYLGAIKKLRDRGYSYAEVTDWLNKHLVAQLDGAKITRAQVYHAFRFVWEKEHQEFEAAYARGEVIEVDSISDDEAEARASAADGDSRLKEAPQKKAKKKKG